MGIFIVFFPNKDEWEKIFTANGQKGIAALLDNPMARGKANEQPLINFILCITRGNTLVCLVYMRQKLHTLRNRMHETFPDKTPGIDYIIQNEPLDRDEYYAVAHQGPSKDHLVLACFDFYLCVRGEQVPELDEVWSSADGMVDSSGVWTACEEQPDEPIGKVMPGVSKFMLRDEYQQYCYWGYRKLHGKRAAGRKPPMLDAYFTVVEGVRTVGGPKEWAARDAEAFLAFFASEGR